MIGRAISKVVWLGRATTFCVGLTVVLAVVLSMATTALAAVPGDIFKLGRLNAIDRVTALAGSAAGPLFKVDNNGGGPALALESNPGKPPLTANADAGKATNLNADRLDGKDASAFLPSDARAASAEDANTLDGRDSTGFYAAGSKVADAENVDGLDSNQLMRSTTYYHRNTSALSSDGTQTVTASCPRSPREYMAISGGASVAAPDVAGGTALAEVPVALKVDRPEGRSSWVAGASETSPYDGEWAVRAHVVCVLQTQSYAYPADEDGR